MTGPDLFEALSCGAMACAMAYAWPAIVATLGGVL